MGKDGPRSFKLRTRLIWLIGVGEGTCGQRKIGKFFLFDWSFQIKDNVK